MARGGKRPGAGRPRGSASKKAKVSAAALMRSGRQPLEVLLLVMDKALEDGDWKTAREAAKDAAPYIHQKFSATDQPAKPHPEQAILPLWESKPKAEAAPGKKETARLEAETAGQGTEWGDLLNPDRPN